MYISEFSVHGLRDFSKYWNCFLGIYEWFVTLFYSLFAPEGDRHLVCLCVFASLTRHLEFHMAYLSVIKITSKIDDISAYQDSVYST